MEGSFRIVTTVYNAEEYITDCILSVLRQTDENWTQVIVVDGATDDTYNRAVKAARGDERIEIILVDERKGICNSHLLAHNTIERNQDDVIIHLDGDDQLLYEQSLQCIREIYTEFPDIQATYGSYLAKSKGKCVARHVDLSIPIHEYIKQGWPFSHPRTFRAPLWDVVTEEHLKDEQGNFYTAAVDVAMMVPILKAAKDKIGFISMPLYYYNDESPLNEDKVNLQDQVRCALDVYRKHNG